MKKYKLLSWHQLGSVNTFKLINSFPFDYHVIDFEHGSHMNNEVYPNLKTKNNLIARVSNRNKKYYSWLLDIGYDGIILSDVKDESEVHNLIECTSFNPSGNRGLGYCQSNNFGKDIKKFITKKHQPILGIQIESVQGINILPNIISKYKSKINFYMLGPYDLSNDAGVPGDFNSKTYKDLVRKFYSIISKNNLNKGVHVVNSSRKELEDAIHNKYDYIAYSTDAKLIIDSLNSII